MQPTNVKPEQNAPAAPAQGKVAIPLKPVVVKKNYKVLIYVYKQGIVLISGANPKSPTILPLQFAANAVLDGEIMDVHELIKVLANFFITNNIHNDHYSLLVSDDYTYRKILTSTTLGKMELEAKDFIEATPHEYVLSKVFKVGKNNVAAATNKDMMRAIEDELKKLDNTKEVVATAAFDDAIKKLCTSFTSDNAIKLLARYSTLRAWSMQEVDETGGIWNVDLTGGSGENEDGDKKPTSLIKVQNNTTVYAGVFGVLILVLGVLVVTNMNSLFPPKKPPLTGPVYQPNQPVNAVAPTAVPTAADPLVPNTPTDSTNVVVPAIALIIVIEGVDVEPVKTLQTSLTLLGYNNITQKIAELAPSKTTILIKKDLDKTKKDPFVKEVTRLLQSASIVESETIASDVVIKLAK
jgi:hypothetical protein